MPRYRLLARAEINGAIRDPGFVFELADGEKGPHRTVVASNHGSQIVDHMNQDADGLVDVPLYEEFQEPAPAPEKSADEIRTELEAKVAEAEHNLAAFDEEHPREPAAPEHKPQP